MKKLLAIAILLLATAAMGAYLDTDTTSIKGLFAPDTTAADSTGGK